MPAVAVSWDSHYSSMDKYHQNSMNLMTNIGGVHSTTSGIHMSSPAYLPSPFTTTTGASFTNSTSGGDSYLPRAPNSFSYPSPSFESYTTNASTFTHGYTSSASSSTAPLSSPDGYYGVPAYPQTWEPENLDAIKQEAAQQTAGGPMKKSPRRRQKAPKTSSESNEPPSESGTRRRTRRYKTPSPQILRVRREMANARERRRMNNLNSAYEMLRQVLPDLDEGRRLSKMETLQMAQMYIECLGELITTSS